jgi:hypothetical protein
MLKSFLNKDFYPSKRATVFLTTSFIMLTQALTLSTFAFQPQFARLFPAQTVVYFDFAASPQDLNFLNWAAQKGSKPAACQTKCASKASPLEKKPLPSFEKALSLMQLYFSPAMAFGTWPKNTLYTTTSVMTPSKMALKSLTKEALGFPAQQNAHFLGAFQFKDPQETLQQFILKHQDYRHHFEVQFFKGHMLLIEKKLTAVKPKAGNIAKHIMRPALTKKSPPYALTELEGQLLFSDSRETLLSVLEAFKAGETLSSLPHVQGALSGLSTSPPGTFILNIPPSLLNMLLPDSQAKASQILGTYLNLKTYKALLSIGSTMAGTIDRDYETGLLQLKYNYPLDLTSLNAMPDLKADLEKIYRINQPLASYKKLSSMPDSFISLPGLAHYYDFYTHHLLGEGSLKWLERSKLALSGLQLDLRKDVVSLLENEWSIALAPPPEEKKLDWRHPSLAMWLTNSPETALRVSKLLQTAKLSSSQFETRPSALPNTLFQDVIEKETPQNAGEKILFSHGVLGSQYVFATPAVAKTLVENQFNSAYPLTSEDTLLLKDLPASGNAMILMHFNRLGQVLGSSKQVPVKALAFAGESKTSAESNPIQLKGTLNILLSKEAFASFSVVPSPAP